MFQLREGITDAKNCCIHSSALLMGDAGASMTVVRGGTSRRAPKSIQKCQGAAPPNQQWSFAAVMTPLCGRCRAVVGSLARSIVET
jgi:hypothetical protein